MHPLPIVSGSGAYARSLPDHSDFDSPRVPILVVGSIVDTSTVDTSTTMRVAGIDLGLVRNSTAWVAWDGTPERMTLLDEHEWKPGATVLRLDRILPAIRMRAASLRVTRIGHDQHYAQSVVEAFDDTRIECVRTPGQISDTYFKMRRALEQGQIDISKASDRFEAQLRVVAYHVSQSGNILVALPKMPDGSHCDLISAAIAGYHAMTAARDAKLLGAGERRGKLGLPRENEIDEQSEDDSEE